MTQTGLTGLTPQQAVKEWETRVLDPRPRVRTGYPSMDALLNRGGFAPGELVILAGRTRTRKTTVTLNIIANMLREGVKVGFVGLDEPPASYVAKLASVLVDVPHMELEDRWHDEDVRERLAEYKRLTSNFSITKGYRPDFGDLTKWLRMHEDFDDEGGIQVVFLDYISLLTRDKYAGAEVQRISRLIEELQVWTSEQGVVTVALHQVGRMDEGSGGRYHGDTPMSLEGLKYGGEEIADVVMSTYRPSLDPVGNLDLEDAYAHFPQTWSQDKVVEAWTLAKGRVKKYEYSTFVQLLKNRPGTEVSTKGVELYSPTTAMRMVERGPALTSTMQHRPIHVGRES